MRAEILAIGDELVAGHRVDTNSAWLSRQLRHLGIIPARHTTVGDRLEELVATITDLATRADIVVSTGGLGPTQDDLTRQALAQATGRPLETDEGMLEHIRGLFARRGRSMPDSNRLQAQRPAGSAWIPNPHGTAPGIDCRLEIDDHSCRWLALPGVPAEMQEMWHDSVAERIRGTITVPRSIAIRELRCFGLGESTLESRLPRSLLRGQNPEIGITVSRGTITLRVTAHGATPDEAEALLDPVVRELEQSLGHLIFGYGDQTLEGVVLAELRRRGHTLVTLEGPSLGQLASRLASSDPEGFTYLGGNIDPRLTDDEEDAESPSSALGERLRQHVKAARATTGLGMATARPGTARLVVLMHDDLFQKTIPLRAHPEILADLAAKHALNFLRLHFR